MKWKGQIDGPLSQYATFDDKYNVKVSFGSQSKVVLVVVVLLFYVHGKHLRSCRDGQLT